MPRRLYNPIYLIKAFLSAIIFSITVYALFVIGPVIETTWYPVVGKMTILLMRSQSPSSTMIRVQFEKLRACDYIGITWQRGDPVKRFERVNIQLFREPGDITSPNRPRGAQQAGPWIVNMPISEITTQSFVDVYHRCHPLWTSVTRIYP